jgi:hypothetical protein
MCEAVKSPSAVPTLCAALHYSATERIVWLRECAQGPNCEGIKITFWYNIPCSILTRDSNLKLQNLKWLPIHDAILKYFGSPNQIATQYTFNIMHKPINK